VKFYEHLAIQNLSTRRPDIDTSIKVINDGIASAYLRKRCPNNGPPSRRRTRVAGLGGQGENKKVQNCLWLDELSFFENALYGHVVGHG